jgi:ABC-type branched-subunit amino acid transport system substrate-binding protein/predicted negative regulator of RcsB-dependent stress response
VRRALALLAIALGWLGCAALGSLSGPEVSEEERRDYSEALSMPAHDPLTAEQHLTAFVEKWPKSPLAGDAAFRMAELAQARGDQEAALRRYHYVVRNFPRSDRIDAARLGVARIEFERGNLDAAVRLLSQTQLRELSDEERRQAHRLLAKTATDPAAKLEWLAKLRSDQPDADGRAVVDAEIDAVLAQLDTEALERVARRVGPDVPASRALLVAAARALDAGDLARARNAIERASRWPLALPYGSQLALAADRLRQLESGASDSGLLPSFRDFAGAEPPSTRAAAGSIGVVLPLTGNFASLGEETLRGILLAAGAFGESSALERAPSIRISIRDSGGSPARAAQAVTELARERSVSAIIGPLLSEECEAAAIAAEAAQVPLLALTTREDVARGRSYVFRLRTRPIDEVQALADHVMRELGAQRFAILYPRDAYGTGVSGLFWSAVEERGGRVVALAAYDPDATDFADPIRRLVGYELLTRAEKELIEEREELIRSARRLPPEEASIVREEARAMPGPDGEPLPPIIDFDALFIPESHEKVVLIAPQLAFHEATGAMLLGTDAWNDPELISIGRDHVEGALYTASFYADSSVGYVRDFADRYAATFGTAADDLSAHAYDAAKLVFVQFARGARSRGDVRKGILAASAFPGVSGVLAMRADGNARKRPFLLGVKRGHIVEID